MRSVQVSSISRSSRLRSWTSLTSDGALHGPLTSTPITDSLRGHRRSDRPTATHGFQLGVTFALRYQLPIRQSLSWFERNTHVFFSADGLRRITRFPYGMAAERSGPRRSWRHCRGSRHCSHPSATPPPHRPYSAMEIGLAVSVEVPCLERVPVRARIKEIRSRL